MNKEFVTYEQALALKELGFDEPCFAYYLAGGIRFKEYKDSQNKNSAFYNNTVCSIPLYQQAFRWFREKHDLVHRIDRDGGWWICTILNLYDEKEQGTIEIHIEHCYPDTYEEAELACLIKLIEIVKNIK
jgi:hypothetical protein